MKIQVFDPPMCCSTGVCGPSVDQALIQFAADLKWLEKQGVSVVRFNLSQQPDAFVGNETVKSALAKEGNDCLPLIVLDGTIVCSGKYPTRAALAGYADIETNPEIEANEEVKKNPFKMASISGSDAEASCCCGPTKSDSSPTKKKSDKSSCC